MWSRLVFGSLLWCGRWSSPLLQLPGSRFVCLQMEMFYRVAPVSLSARHFRKKIVAFSCVFSPHRGLSRSLGYRSAFSALSLACFHQPLPFTPTRQEAQGVVKRRQRDRIRCIRLLNYNSSLREEASEEPRQLEIGLRRSFQRHQILYCPGIHSQNHVSRTVVSTI